MYKILPIEPSADTGSSTVYNTPCVIKIDGVSSTITIEGQLNKKYISDLSTDKYLK